MFNKKCFILLLTIIFPACGTIIGNGITDPTGPSMSPIDAPNSNDYDFSAPIEEYTTSGLADCGSFTENSTVAEIDVGRQCIRDALEDCIASKYLYNKENSDGSRFVSFVSVTESTPGICKLRVHTVSNVEPNPIGDQIRTCTTLQANEIPEVACGILN